MTCLTDERLERLARGEAGAVRGWLWRRHVRGCPSCRARLAEREDDRRFVAELRAAVSPDATRPERSDP
jgi:hypothetical protein